MKRQSVAVLATCATLSLTAAALLFTRTNLPANRKLRYTWTLSQWAALVDAVVRRANQIARSFNLPPLSDALDRQQTVTVPLNVGPGGGGQLWAPSISPVDDSLMYIACDTGALFMSNNRGQSWNVIDGRDMRGSQCPVAFAPSGTTIFAWDGLRGLGYADREGNKWKSVSDPQLPMSENGKTQPLVVTSILCTKQFLYLGTGVGESITDLSSSSLQRGIYRVPLYDLNSKIPDWHFFPLEDNEDVRKLVFVSIASVIDTPPYRPPSYFGFLACGTSQRILTLVESYSGMDWTPLPMQAIQPPYTENNLIRGFNAVSDSTQPATQSSTWYYVTVGAYNLGKSRNLLIWSPSQNQWTSPTSPPPDTAAFIGLSPQNPRRVYTTTYSSDSAMPRVHRSDNNGDSWSLIFARRSDSTVGSPYNVQPGWFDYTPVEARLTKGFPSAMLDIAVSGSNADVVLVGDRFGPSVTTDGGDAGGCARLIGTILGAEIDDWAECFTAQDGFDGSGRMLWTSIGMEPTTCFQYLVDPHDPTHHYICYTDIGFHQSDGTNDNPAGIDWRFVEAPPVPPVGGQSFVNFNQIAVDSATGAQWAAVSEQHDIPFQSQLGGATGGGVLAFRSSAAESWQDGQLNGDTMSGPVVSVAVDETTPQDNRTVWVSVWGQGIYRRVGSAWLPNAPQDSPTKNFYRIQPWTNGRVLVITAAHSPDNGTSLDASGSLWSCSVSTDENGNVTSWNWTDIGSGLDALAKGGSFTCPVDFAVDPFDQKHILVCTQHVDKNVGGVFETRDEGTTWNEVSGGLNETLNSRAPLNQVEAFAPFFNPANEGEIWVTTRSHGIWRNFDGGQTWAEFTVVPFVGALRVSFHPTMLGLNYITTFGGGAFAVYTLFNI